ncbi:nucleotidyltransferase family protein [Mesorhizobium sp. LSHC414A00]|uniref:nucleotidyltransferase family protein n=1 Tax=Mesorhizobium sp. LSHC414A00 TaxID=1287287 RepID=UPI0018DE71F6|nr:nucleotidyltransferase family protein [Mesorhizobium sp. LSHC414A00]
MPTLRSEGIHAPLAFALMQWCGERFEPKKFDLDLYAVEDETLRFLRSRQIDSLYILAAGQVDSWQRAYDMAWSLQRAALIEIVGSLVQAGVRTLVFKGIELQERFLQGHSLAILGDLDILIQRSDVESAKAVLYALGFRHAFFKDESAGIVSRDIREVAQVELTHYELAPFVKLVPLEPEPWLIEVARGYNRNPLHLLNGQPVLVIEVDIHHNVASDAEPEMFFDRAVSSAHGVGETFCSADHIWLNLSRYYNEVALHGKQSLRPLAYTVPLISDPSVDWEIVQKVATDMNLGRPLYYYLGLADRLVPGFVPAETLRTVLASDDGRLRDWGWQVGKIFDVDEPFPLHHFHNQQAMADSLPTTFRGGKTDGPILDHSHRLR